MTAYRAVAKGRDDFVARFFPNYRHALAAPLFSPAHSPIAAPLVLLPHRYRHRPKTPFARNWSEDHLACRGSGINLLCEADWSHMF